jgi:DNA-binding transcriptional LysR family regulator
MNYRQLEAFSTTMRTGSVTAAAKALYISQPSISRLLKELEYSVGVQLFHHQKGRFNPTREAEILFEEVERSFVGLKTIRTAAGQINDLSLSRLRLGCPAALSVKVLPEAISRFAEQHPKTHISFSVRSSRRISEWVAAYQLDLGIVISYYDRPSISILDKVKSNFVAVMPTNHPLAKLKRINWEDMKDEPLISIEREYLLRQTQDEGLKKLLEKQVRFETELSFTACSLVQQGLGIALVDPFTASHFINLGLVTRKIQIKIPFEFYIIHAEHRKPSLVVESFLPILGETIEHICAED